MTLATTPPAYDADRAAFLLALGDALLGVEAPDALIGTALALLRHRLGADRCVWGEVDAEEHFLALGNACAPGMTPIEGRFPIALAGPAFVDALRRGETFADEAPTADDGRAVFAALGVASHIAVPLLAAGRLVAILGVHSSAPRRWTAAERTLARDVLVRCRDAIERARALEALRLSEARFQMAARASHDALWDWDLTRGSVWWNEGLSEQFGHDPATVAPTPEWWGEQIHPADRERVLTSIHTVIDGGGAGWVAEYRFRRADGTWADVLDRGHVVRDAQGRARRMLGTMQDLTPRRRAEATLALREEEFRTLADNIAQLAWMADASGGLFWYNRRWYEYTGTTFEAMAGWGWQVVHHPDHLERVITGWRAAHATGAEWEDTFPLRSAAGEYRWFLSRAIPIRDATGAVVRWFGTNTDITEQRRTEAELRATQARFEAALEASPVVVFNQDRELRYTWIHNPALGYAAQQVLGRRDRELLPNPADGARVEAIKRRVVETGEPFRGGIQLVQDDTTMHYDLSVRPVHEADGTISGIISTAVDVTARVRDAQRLELAQRMETAGRIAGGVAHEANNQMTVVMGATDFLLRRPDLPPDALADLGYIRAAAERTATICRQLLAYSRRQVLRPEVIAPDDVVRDTEPLLARALGGRLTLALDVGSPGVTVRADRGQLEQVLLNLAINARDASPAGGRFALTSRVALFEATELARLGMALEPGCYWHLAAADDGEGMSEATRARIFEPFFTTKPLGQGTGLGLSMVQGVLRQSGGDIGVESAPGTGATFHLLLPVAAGEAQLPITPASRATAATSASGSNGLGRNAEPGTSLTPSSSSGA